MAREYGRLWLSIWNNRDFLDLDMPPQWLYMALLSQPGMATCGVLSFAPNRWATLTPKVTGRQVEKAVAALEEGAFIVVDRGTDEVLIRSHLRHDKPLRTTNTAKAVVRTWRQVASVELRRAIVVELHRLHDDGRFSDWLGWQVPEIKDLVALDPKEVV